MPGDRYQSPKPIRVQLCIMYNNACLKTLIMGQQLLHLAMMNGHLEISWRILVT